MKYLIFFLFISLSITSIGQTYKFSSGEVSFFAEASVEDIAAKSYQVESSFDPSTGKITFEIPIKSFVFKKSLMKQHFNEKYMESDKYPVASFTGIVIGFDATTSSEQNVKASGQITIHGVTKEMDIDGKLTNDSNEIKLSTNFVAQFKEFKIKIPKLFWTSVAEEVEVSMAINYKPN